MLIYHVIEMDAGPKRTWSKKGLRSRSGLRCKQPSVGLCDTADRRCWKYQQWKEMQRETLRKIQWENHYAEPVILEKDQVIHRRKFHAF